MRDDFPPPEDYSEKEVYAFFGLAAYYGQVLEKGLVNMVVVYRAFGLPITPKQFDDLFNEHESKTFGQLLVLAKKHGIPIPDSISKLLSEALNKRNYLNHHFFADHAGHFAAEKTRKLMIERLCSYIELFRNADRASETVYKPILTKMGLTDEFIEKHVSDLLMEAAKDKIP
jgi:hypothetical protein